MENVESLIGKKLSILKNFNSERDKNFLVRAEDGELLVVKLFGPHTEDAELQVDTLRRIEGQVSLVPRVVAFGYPILVCTFIEGSVLSDVMSRREWMIGEAVGRLARTLANIPCQSRSKPLEWNFSKFNIAIRDLPNEFRKIADRIGPEIRKVLSDDARDSWSLCHYDLNDDNIIVQPNGEVGIIDFGDVDSGPGMVDPAICLCYLLINGLGNQEKTVIREFLDGYESVVGRLSPEEVHACAVLVVARSLMSLSIQTRNSSLNPLNYSYLSVSIRGNTEFLRGMNLDEFFKLFL
jgi:Ser/Thr protein kinase RdoA (MazF antagonist)